MVNNVNRLCERLTWHSPIILRCPESWMEYMGRTIYPLEGQQLTREVVRIIVAEAHVWQKRADLEGANLSGEPMMRRGIE